MGIELSRQGNGLGFAGVQQPHLLPPGRLGIVRSGHWGDRDPIRSASSPLPLMLRHFEIDGPRNIDLSGVLKARAAPLRADGAGDLYWTRPVSPGGILLP